MRTLQAVVIGSQQRVAPPLLPLGLGPSLEQFLGLLFVQLEFAPDRLGIATIKAVLGKLLLLRQPDVAIRLIVRPTQVVYVLPPLQKLADTLEPVSQLHRNRVEVEAPTLLKVGELRNFKSVEQNLPADIQEVYLKSLGVIGIDLREHDIRFEEDNWESPTLGAWGIGWQVLLDGLEITQFTYFQQSGGVDLDPISVELTYGLERICQFLQGRENVYDLRWSDDKTYGDIRLAEEQQFSGYSFDRSDAKAIRSEFELHERQAKELLEGWAKAEGKDRRRYPLLAAYDHCLKCSHLFNLLDARGVISTTERAALMARVRAVACRTAVAYLEQLTAASTLGGGAPAEVRQ